MDLTICPACQRHVRDGEGRCPFCGSRVGRAPALPAWVGPLTRAAIVYGAASLGACSGEPPTPEPPIEVTAQAWPEATEVAMAPGVATPARAAFEARQVDPQLADEDDGDARRERAHAEARKHPPRHVRCCMPYGAPPADFSV